MTKTNFTLQIKTSDMESEHFSEFSEIDNVTYKIFLDNLADFKIEEELSNPNAKSSPGIGVVDNCEEFVRVVGVDFSKEDCIICYTLTYNQYHEENTNYKYADNYEFGYTEHQSYRTKNLGFVKYFVKIFFDRDYNEMQNLLKNIVEEKVDQYFTLRHLDGQDV